MKDQQKHTVFAPQPTFVSSSQRPANRVISVQLNADEAVQWTWMSLPDGTSYVSGYTICQKTN
jgi:hypothetical protein